METMLIVVTMISLALAIALGVIVWQLRRDERERADARVAALVEGFAQQPPIDARVDTPIDTRIDAPIGTSVDTPVASAIDRRIDTPIEQVDLSADTDWLSQFPPATAATPAAEAAEDARPMFGHFSAEATEAREEAGHTGESNPWRTAAVAAALFVGLVLAVWLVTHTVITMSASASASTSTPSSAAAAAATPAPASVSVSAPTSAPASGPASAAPLELLTLRHDRSGSTLTISGRVRNPPNGARQEHLVAVIFFFNQRGDYQTSVRTPLDFRTLAPGDESPFQVSTPMPDGVSRFRVSFRHDEGEVVPHVDRRQSVAAGS